jgi:hypothetical protein
VALRPDEVTLEASFFFELTFLLEAALQTVSHFAALFLFRRSHIA